MSNKVRGLIESQINDGIESNFAHLDNPWANCGRNGCEREILAILKYKRHPVLV